MNAKTGKLGFIGAGNMAKAMIQGLIQSGVYDRDRLLAFDKDKKALENISNQYRICYSASNNDLVNKSSIVVLSIKPQNIREVLEEIKGEIRNDHLVISIAAGIPLKMISSVINQDIPLIRVMPNTPALIQKGVSALAGSHLATPEHMVIAREIFNAVGDTVEVDETMMDAVTALSGSGPGYVFKIMECMVDAGQAVGLERDISHRLVVQTFLGAAHLAEKSEHGLSRLREMVTSPGGTTEAGLAVFNKGKLNGVINEVIKAARRRSIELGENY